MGQQMLDLEAQNKDLVQRVATLQTIEQQLESMLESDHQIQVRARSMHYTNRVPTRPPAARLAGFSWSECRRRHAHVCTTGPHRRARGGAR